MSFPLSYRVALRAVVTAACACLSLSLLAGSHHAAVAAPAAPAVSSAATVTSSATKVTLPAGSLGIQGLKTFADMIGWNGTALVVINGRSDLAFKLTDATADPTWADVVNELASATFTVFVSKAGPIGTAGALVYAMAKERIVVQGAMVPRLPSEVAALCAGSLCSALATHDISVNTRTPSTDRADTVEYPAGQIAPVPGGGPDPWLVVALIAAAIAALWFAGGNRVVRRFTARPAAAASYGPGVAGVSWAGPDPGSRSSAPGPGVRGPGEARGPGDARGGQPNPTQRLPVTFYDSPPAGRRPALARPGQVARPGPAHGPGQAIVRTTMGPEGYVEIDGVLYRATWRGSRTAPRRGTVVKVGQDSHGELVAVEDGPATGGSGPARP